MRERPLGEARTTFVHRRGECPPGTGGRHPRYPRAVLAPIPPGTRPDRLALARWLVAEDSPWSAGSGRQSLAWQAFFGRGLVATIEDFGTRGERPTHPELLDWLATEFPRQGWSQKALHRLIVTSATYQQSSKASRDLIARDPRNELLARGPRFRVESETVRDIALAALGAAPTRRSAGRASTLPSRRGSRPWPTGRRPGRPARAPIATGEGSTPTTSGPPRSPPSPPSTPRRPRSPASVGNDRTRRCRRSRCSTIRPSSRPRGRSGDVS